MVNNDNDLLANETPKKDVSVVNAYIDTEWYLQQTVLEFNDTNFRGLIHVKLDGVENFNSTASNGLFWETWNSNELGLNLSDYDVHDLDFVFLGDDKYNNFTYHTTCQLIDYYFSLGINYDWGWVDYYYYELMDEYKLRFDSYDKRFLGLNFTLIYNDKKTNFTLSNNSGIYEHVFDLGKLDPLLHNFTVVYPETDFSPSRNVSALFNLYARIDFKYDDVKFYNNNDSISLKLPVNASGNFVVILDDELYYNSSMVDGQASVELNYYNLSMGSHTLKAIYDGNDYNVSSCKASFDVLPGIKYPKKVLEGDNVTIEAYGSEGYDGNKSLFFYNAMFYPDMQYEEFLYFVNGYAEFSNAERYAYKLFDDKYSIITFRYEDTHNTIYILNDTASYLDADVKKNYYKSDSVSIPVHCSPAFSNKIEVFIDDNSLENITDYCDIDFNNLDVGSHTLEFKYGGDEFYKPINKSYTFNVIPFKVEASVNEDGSGNLLIDTVDDGYFTVYIDGKKYATKIPYDGKIIVPFENITVGEHNYDVVFTGKDNLSLSWNDSFYLEVNNCIVEYNETYLIGENILLNVTLPSSANGTIILELKAHDDYEYSHFIKNYTSDVVGNVARFNITDLDMGSYSFGVYFKADNYLSYLSFLNSRDYFYIFPEINTNLTKYIKSGEDIYIGFKADDNFSGIFNLRVDGKVSYITLVNGTANVTLSNLSDGEHAVRVDFNNSYNYWRYEFYVGCYSINIPDSKNIFYGENKTISIELPDSARGKLVIGDQVIELVDGKASWSLESHLGHWYFYYYVQYVNETSEWAPSVECFVDCYVVPIIEYPEVMNLGEDKYISLNVPNSDGTLTVKLTDLKSDVLTLNTNGNNVSLSSLHSGEYKFKVSYEGIAGRYDTQNLYKEFEGVIKVLALTPTMNVNVKNDNNSVEITLPGDASGKYLLDVDGVKYWGNITGEKTVVEIPELTKGIHNITALYSGNDKYCEVTNFTVVNVKSDANMTVDIPEKIIYCESGNVTVSLDENATGNVTLSVDGKDIDSVPVVKGSATLPLANLTVGNHTVCVSYSGDDKYVPVNRNATVEVIKPKTTLVIEVKDISVGEKAVIAIIAPDDATGAVLINVDDQTPYEDLVNGRATVTISGLSSGEKNVTVMYLGDKKYDKLTNSTTFKVTKHDAEMDVNISDKAKSGKGGNVTVSLPNDASGNVTLSVDGKDVATVPVVKGSADVSIPELTKGNHTVCISYSGDGIYDAYSENITVNIKNIINTVLSASKLEMKVKDGSKFNATLKDEYGNPLANKTIKFTIVGKTYSVKTNEKGVAEFPIGLKPGSYSASVAFDGDSEYNASSVANTSVEVYVKARLDQNKNLVKDYHNDAQPFTVRALDKYGKAAANQYVKVTVSGKTYTIKTNAKGIAVVPINLRPGTYKITCEYEGTKVVNTITVKNVLYAFNRQYKRANSYKFSATLKYSNGKAIAGKVLTFTVKGKTYTAKTNAKGEATVYLRGMNVGKYTLVIKYFDYRFVRTVNILR